MFLIISLYPFSSFIIYSSKFWLTFQTSRHPSIVLWCSGNFWQLQSAINPIALLWIRSEAFTGSTLWFISKFLIKAGLLFNSSFSFLFEKKAQKSSSSNFSDSAAFIRVSPISIMPFFLAISSLIMILIFSIATFLWLNVFIFPAWANAISFNHWSVGAILWGRSSGTKLSLITWYKSWWSFTKRASSLKFSCPSPEVGHSSFPVLKVALWALLWVVWPWLWPWWLCFLWGVSSSEELMVHLRSLFKFRLLKFLLLIWKELWESLNFGMIFFSVIILWSSSIYSCCYSFGQFLWKESKYWRESLIVWSGGLITLINF